jgi:hypothetical protein
MSEGDRLTFFISYTSHSPDDVRLAEFLAVQIRQAGHELFLDKQIGVGVRWSDEIEKNLEACNRFVVLLSEASVTRDMVREEVRRAHTRAQSGSVAIMPIRVRYRGELPYEMAARLNPIQQISWDGPSDNESVLARVLGAGPVGAEHGSRRRPAWPPEDPVGLLRGIDGKAVTPSLVPIQLIRAVAEACSERAEALIVVQQAEAWLLEAGEIEPGILLRLDPQFLPDVRDNPLNYWLQAFSRAATRGARVLVALLAALPPGIATSRRDLIARALDAAQSGLGESAIQRT